VTLPRAGIILSLVLVSGLVIGIGAADPAGDQFNFATPPAFDLVGYDISFAPGNLVVSLEFDSAHAGDLNWLGGWVDFDTDQNPCTGWPSHAELFGVEPYPVFGMDYAIELIPDTGDAYLIRFLNGQDYIVDDYPATINGSTVTVVIPRCLEAPCEGIVMDARFDAVILIGNSDGPTDLAPNDGGVIEGIPQPGDLDEDGDVDSTDCELLQLCLTGSMAGPPASGCSSADLDADNDIDQTDFGLLQEAMTGSY